VILKVELRASEEEEENPVARMARLDWPLTIAFHHVKAEAEIDLDCFRLSFSLPSCILSSTEITLLATLYRNRVNDTKPYTSGRHEQELPKCQEPLRVRFFATTDPPTLRCTHIGIGKLGQDLQNGDIEPVAKRMASINYEHMSRTDLVNHVYELELQVHFNIDFIPRS
jgi:hypothetical protein